MGRQSDERAVGMELSRIGVRGIAGIFANSLRSGQTRTFLRRLGQDSSGSPHSPRILVACRRHDVVLEFLRLGERHQRPADDSDSGTIHRSDLRSDAVAATATESAPALQDLALSAALRPRPGGLAVHVCLRGLAVYRARLGDAELGRSCVPTMVATSQELAIHGRIPGKLILNDYSRKSLAA